MQSELKAKTEEFANSLKEHPLVTAFNLAKKEYEEDAELQSKIALFEKKQKALYYGTERVPMEELQKLRDEIMNNEKFVKLNRSKADAFALCKAVNEKLTDLTGLDIGKILAQTSSSCSSSCG
ncbi:MAG: YlbF family regulator [Nitrospirae bacterium]|nr:YlbF family regulator [Nitrospirota bacterium]